jgi:copper transport protein
LILIPGGRILALAKAHSMLKRAFTGLAVALVAVLCLTTGALAHAALLSTFPASNAVFEQAPANVHLHFNEPVDPVSVTLIAPDGQGTDLLSAATGGEMVMVTLPNALARGTHVLSWRVVSIDGHPVGGSLVFSVGSVTGATGDGPATDQAVSLLVWSVRAALLIAFCVGIGGAAFGAVTPLPGILRGAFIALVGIGALLAPVALGLQGLDALALPLSAASEARVWVAGLSTSYGTTAIVATIAFMVAIAALVLRSSVLSATLACVSLMTAALSVALSGHAGSANPQWLTRPALFLHLAGIIFWAGALLPLWVLLRDRTPASDLALERFSKVIPFAVAPILASGVTLAFIQMGAPGPQWLVPYGAILGTKLCLLVLLFWLAWRNRRWLTKPVLAGDAKARRRLRNSIRLEVLLVLAILALVAGWRFTPPPRALAVASPAAASIVAHFHAGSTMSMVSISPGHAGFVDLEIQFADMDGKSISPSEVSVSVSEPHLGIEPLKTVAVGDGKGNWRVDGLAIPVAGTWTVELDVRTSRFELVKLRGEIVVP